MIFKLWKFVNVPSWDKMPQTLNCNGTEILQCVILEMQTQKALGFQTAGWSSLLVGPDPQSWQHGIPLTVFLWKIIETDVLVKPCKYGDQSSFSGKSKNVKELLTVSSKECKVLLLREGAAVLRHKVLQLDSI